MQESSSISRSQSQKSQTIDVEVVTAKKKEENKKLRKRSAQCVFLCCAMLVILVLVTTIMTAIITYHFLVPDENGESAAQNIYIYIQNAKSSILEWMGWEAETNGKCNQVCQYKSASSPDELPKLPELQDPYPRPIQTC